VLERRLSQRHSWLKHRPHAAALRRILDPKPASEYVKAEKQMLAGLLLLGSPSLFAAADASRIPPPAQTQINFARDIQPIFERSCLQCHGPEKPKSRFRLDSREAALKGGQNGTDIIVGDSTNSPLIHSVA